MNLRLVRIDDRLIHGQVIHGWMPRLAATLIVVADAELADSPDDQMIARLAVPPGIDVIFVRPAGLEALMRDEARPAIVLFRTPVEAQEAVVEGFAPDSLNLGNLHFEPGKVQVRKTFCCNEQELTALRELRDRGITVEYQPAPDLKRVLINPDELSAAG